MNEYSDKTNDELDALAAERVMGYESDGPDEDLPIAMWHAKHVGHICSHSEWRPTTDPRDERAIVDAMVARGFAIVNIMRHHSSGGWDVFFADTGDPKCGQACDAILGRAVVIASLIAVEGGEDAP